MLPSWEVGPLCRQRIPAGFRKPPFGPFGPWVFHTGLLQPPFPGGQKPLSDNRPNFCFCVSEAGQPWAVFAGAEDCQPERLCCVCSIPVACAALQTVWLALPLVHDSAVAQ